LSHNNSFATLTSLAAEKGLVFDLSVVDQIREFIYLIIVLNQEEDPAIISPYSMVPKRFTELAGQLGISCNLKPFWGITAGQ